MLIPSGVNHDNINWLCPVNWRHPLNDGLVSWWLALQNQPGWKSNQWLDLCDPVHGNHGTLTNMDPAADWTVASRPGGFGALDFDGTNDYVSLPVGIKTSIDASKQASMSMWVKLSEATPSTAGKTGFVTLTEVGDGPGGTVSSHYPFTDGKFYINTLTTTRYAITPSVNINREEWHLVTIVSRPGIDGWKMYQNEEEISSQTGEDTFGLRSSVWIGGSEKASSGHFFLNGQIKDVRIANRAWSAIEVQNYYKLSQQCYPGILNRIPSYYPYSVAAGGGGGVGISKLAGVGGLAGQYRRLVG